MCISNLRWLILLSLFSLTNNFLLFQGVYLFLLYSFCWYILNHLLWDRKVASRKVALKKWSVLFINDKSSYSSLGKAYNRKSIITKYSQQYQTYVKTRHRFWLRLFDSLTGIILYQSWALASKIFSLWTPFAFLEQCANISSATGRNDSR